MSDEIVSQLSQKIAEKFVKPRGRKVSPSEPLLSSGLVDSFSLVDLAMMVEDTFGVRIDDFELNAETFDTIDELAGLIRERQV